MDIKTLKGIIDIAIEKNNIDKALNSLLKYVQLRKLKYESNIKYLLDEINTTKQLYDENKINFAHSENINSKITKEILIMIQKIEDSDKIEQANTKFIENSLDIFISHSSVNRNIAAKLIQALKFSMNIKTDKIKCTSVNAYMLKGGRDINFQLLDAVKNSRLVLGIISKDSVKSHYVLFELGARWGLELPFKLLVFNDEDYSILKGPLSNTHIINISKQAEVLKLIEEIASDLEFELENSTVYIDSITELIESIKQE